MRIICYGYAIGKKSEAKVALSKDTLSCKIVTKVEGKKVISYVKFIYVLYVHCKYLWGL